MGEIGAWVLDVISALGYLGLALLLVAENLFPPIPSEVVLPLAGFLVGRGDLGFWQALLAATFGSVTGALILYALGRYGGRRLERFANRAVSCKDVAHGDLLEGPKGKGG